MNKKNLFSAFAHVYIFALSIGVMVSCSNKELEQAGIDTKQVNNVFIGLRSNYSEIAKSNLEPKNNCSSSGMKKAQSVHSNDVNTTVYLSLPEGLTKIQKDDFIDRFDSSRCINDFIDLIELTGATISTEYLDNADSEITFSESKAREALSPLVSQSKEYLYSKGFTDAEINEMLEENFADETDLIRLVLYVSSDEYANRNYTHNRPTFNLLDLIVTTAHAATIEDHLSDAKNCALSTLGLNFTGYGYASTCTVWSKLAIKTAFKSIVKRMLGPVGAAIMVVEFSLCMWGLEQL